MPSFETAILLFAAGCTSWTIGIFSGGGGSMILVAAVTHLIRVKTVAPVITIASLMASPTRILVSWRLVDWKVVRRYLPRAIGGAIIGSWFLTFAAAPWLRVIVGLFLISTPLQYRFGRRPDHFRCGLPGSYRCRSQSASSPVSSAPAVWCRHPSMIATGAVHSLFIQLTKIATYGSLGVLAPESILEGVLAGAGAIAAILGTRKWLDRFEETWFRRLAILLMLLSGLSLLWRERGLLF